MMGVVDGEEHGVVDRLKVHPKTASKSVDPRW